MPQFDYILFFSLSFTLIVYLSMFYFFFISFFFPTMFRVVFLRKYKLVYFNYCCLKLKSKFYFNINKFKYSMDLFFIMFRSLIFFLYVF